MQFSMTGQEKCDLLYRLLLNIPFHPLFNRWTNDDEDGHKVAL